VSQEWCNARLPEGHGAQHGSKNRDRIDLRQT
jgi:hypothetical protein